MVNIIFYYLQFFMPLIGLALDVFFQIGTFRLFSSLGLLKTEYVGFIMGLLGILFVEYKLFFISPVSSLNFIALLIANLIIYLALAYCYFHFLNLGETARRIRLLIELYNAPRGLTMEEFLERYNAKEIIERRLNRLIDKGQIVYKDSRYYIGSPVMLIIAKIIVTMKLLVLGKKSEFKEYGDIY